MNNTIQTIKNEILQNPQKLIAHAEEDYENEIRAIAETISRNDDIKIVSIAGPSASGKTTTAHILCDMLRKMQEKTEVVSLDDFYLDDEHLPLLPDGRQDIESVNALDKERIRTCLSEVIASGRTVLPKFEFAQRRQNPNAREIALSKKGILIVEGLHAINPVITELVPRKNIFKLYISVNRPIRSEFETTLLSSSQIRLIRRILRDRVFRGTAAAETLKLWSGVVEGERKYLYCFKPEADLHVKTLHLYEPCVYRDKFLPLVAGIDPDTPCYDYFIKTARALEQFPALDDSNIPAHSLIREFIGGGKYT